jgi:exoribonuclease II
VVFVQLGPERSEQLVAPEARFAAPEQDVAEKGKSFRLLQNGARVTFPHRQDRGTKD